MGFFTKIKNFFKSAFGWLGNFFKFLFNSDEFKSFVSDFATTTTQLVLQAAVMKGTGADKRNFVIDGLKKYASDNSLSYLTSFGNLLIEMVYNDLKAGGKITSTD